MARAYPPGRCPHVILIRGTRNLCGTARMLLTPGPILIEKGGEKPIFKSRQDASNCVGRTAKIHAQLKDSMMDGSYWPNGLPDFQIMSQKKWVTLCASQNEKKTT